MNSKSDPWIGNDALSLYCMTSSWLIVMDYLWIFVSIFVHTIPLCFPWLRHFSQNRDVNCMSITMGVACNYWNCLIVWSIVVHPRFSVSFVLLYNFFILKLYSLPSTYVYWESLFIFFFIDYGTKWFFSRRGFVCNS